MAEVSTTHPPAFPGFPDFQANVTFVPLQFFTIVLPHSSRGCVRLVGYMLRRILGWVDTDGNPTREKLQFSYRDLIRDAGVSRENVPAALDEAMRRGCIRCVRPPRAARRGQAAQCGIYELNWDEQGPYTNAPESFNGFYFPEAAVMTLDESGTAVQRPKVARKNIPNAFFDYLLPRERLSVIRVLGAMLFYSIQWGPGGERKVPVTLSISELSRLTQLSRQHVHAAVTDSQAAGYLTCVEPGQFDTNAGIESHPATYAVRWTSTGMAPLGDGNTVGSPAPHSEMPNGGQSEKVNGSAVRKGERDQSEKVNGERSEKVNGISIKKDLKKGTAAAMYHGEAAAPDAAAVDPASVELLVQAGFDQTGARSLAARSSAEIIRQQLEWMPLRRARHSRLGLLRRAIEQNWPKPERFDQPPPPLAETAEVFARYYYAGYHGNEGEPAAEPQAKDVHAAASVVGRLLEIDRNPSLVPEWAREFGRFVRGRQRGDARAKPYLGPAALLHADDFVRRVRLRAQRARVADPLPVQPSRQESFADAYHQYLAQTEQRYRHELPDLYAEFTQHRQQSRHIIESGLCRELPRMLEWFDADATRLSAFAKYFRRHRQHPVLGFEQWDARYNRRPPPDPPPALEHVAG